MEGKGIKRSQRNLNTRQRLFPELNENEIWNWSDKKTKGFITIPRTLPYFFAIMDELAEKPVSSTFFALWCRLWDANGFIKIDNQSELAMESGFSGQRKIQTWRSRMKKLEELGFIRTAPLGDEHFGYVVILSPYVVVKQKYKDTNPGIYNALVQRTEFIGATDLNDDNHIEKKGVKKLKADDV